MAAAPLYSTPGAPLHGAANWMEAADGGRLRTALFQPKGPPRGSVIVSPGRTEPIEKYAEVITELQAKRYAILIHDWRGQGLSQGFPRIGLQPDGVRKGHARGWRLYLSDFSRLLDCFAERLPRPWIGLGHSMGGGLTLLAMSEGEARLDGAVLTAPMLGLRLGTHPPALVEAAAALMSLVGRSGQTAPPAGPRAADGQEDGAGALTHDEVRWARFEVLLASAPDLRLGAPTWGWVQFALALTRRLETLRTLEQIDAPVTIMAAERDRVVANAAQRAAAHRLPKGRYQEVPGAFHEILMETDTRRAVFWEAFDALAEAVGA